MSQPSVEWTAEDYAQWMTPGWEYLESRWSDESSELPVWEGECDRGFLAALDLDEAQLESTPSLRVVYLFMWKLERDISDDASRREILLDPARRGDLLTEAVADSREELGQFRGEDLDWVSDDAQAQLGEGWAQFLTAKLDDVWPEWREQTDPQPLVEWLDAWMDTLVEERRPSDESADVQALAWVSDEAQAQLGAGWADFLTAKLDDVWPEWREQTDPQPLVGWLEAWMDTLVEERAAAGESASGSGAASADQDVEATPDEEPDQVAHGAAAKLAKLIAEPALHEALRSPALAGAQPDDVARLVSEVLAQRAAGLAS